MGSGTVAPQSVADAPAGAEQGFAGDGEQRPLVPRSRSSPRLKPGVSLPGAAGFPNPARVAVDFITLLSYNRGSGG